MNDSTLNAVSARAARARTLMGLLLALPLAALVAGIFACLPVPVGDPEKAKVDPKLVGGWIIANEDGSTSIYLIRDFDQRTYLIQALGFEVLADKSIKPKSQLMLKAWLTTLGKETFICAQPLEPRPGAAADKKEKPIFIVAAVTAKDDELTLRIAKSDSPQLKEAKTREAAEKALADHAGEPDMYSTTMVLKKLAKADAETEAAVLKAFHLADN